MWHHKGVISRTAFKPLEKWCTSSISVGTWLIMRIYSFATYKILIPENIEDIWDVINAAYSIRLWMASRIHSISRCWELLCKTYVYLILNKWVIGTVSGASGLCRTQKARKRRREKNLPGHRGASHPHKIVKLCLAPWLQPVERTGEGSGVEKCIKDKSVAGLKEEGFRDGGRAAKKPGLSRHKGQEIRPADLSQTRKWTVSMSEDGEAAGMSDVSLRSLRLKRSQHTLPPNWLGVASLNHSLYLKRLSDIKMSRSHSPPSSTFPRLPLWFTIEEMNLKFQS